MSDPRTQRGLARYAAPVLGLGAGAAFLYTAFRSVRLDDVARSLAGGRWWPAAPLILLGVALFILAKARRWRALLGDPADIGTAALVRPVAVGLLFNALIAHSGEFARALSLQRAHGRAVSGVLAGIAVERLFDFLVVLAFGFLAGAYADLPPTLAQAMRIVGVFALVLGIAVVLALAVPALLRRLVDRVTAYWPRRLRDWLRGQVAHALEALEPLRRAHGIPLALFWSAVQWAAIVWSVRWCAAVPGLALSAPMAALVLIAIVVMFTLPNAPGYLGATQMAFLGVLGPLGIARDTAVAASFVYTLAVVVPIMLAGVLALSVGRRPSGV